MIVRMRSFAETGGTSFPVSVILNPHVVEVLDAVSLDELAHLLVGRGRLLVRRGHHVIEDDDREVLPDDAVLLEVVLDLADDRGRVVVRQQVVGLDGHDLSGHDVVEPGRPREHLLRECHSHVRLRKP